MLKVLVQFVSPTFKIEEATVSLFNTNAIYQDFAKAAQAFSVFPLQFGVTEIEVSSSCQIEGSLIDIVLRRTADETLHRINFCRFDLNITESALYSGKCDVDLSTYKEIILRAALSSAVFNIGIRENPIPTFDLNANPAGQCTLLAKPGQYRVTASGKSQRAMREFEIANDEVEPRIIEFEPGR